MPVGFLNPILLIGLSAISIPIIVHLLLRRYAKKVVFSSFKFLVKSDKVTHQNRLRELILLLMRILIMAILAFAFARPFLIKAKGAFGGDVISAVIILDNSYSMLYNNNFDKARNKANSIVDGLKVLDQVGLLSLAKSLVPLTVEKETVKSKIRDLKISTVLTDFQLSIKKADQLLAEDTSGKKYIYLITDMQKIGWDNFNFSEKLSPGVEIKIINLGQDDAENMAITNLSIPPVLLDETEPVKIVARVENFSDRQKEVNVALFIENREVKKESVVIPGRNFKDVEFTTFFGESRGTKGYISIGHDKLLLDNKFYYSFRKRGGLNILLVNGSPSNDRDDDSAYFIKEALNPGNDPTGNIKVKTILPQNIEIEDLNKYDAVVLSNISSVSGKAVSKLKEYLSNWGNLIIGLGEIVSGRDYNSTFGTDLLPAELSTPKGDFNDRSKYLTLLTIDFNHPLFMLFKNPRYSNSLQLPRFFKYFQTFSTRNHILARFGNGDPAIIEKSYKNGKILLWTSSFDKKWSNLPVKGIFLPLIHEMLYYLTSSGELISDYRVSQPVTWHGRWKGVKVENPDGEVKKIDFVKGIVIYQDTTLNGFYKVTIENNQDIFAVNLQTKESDLTIENERAVVMQLTSVSGAKATTEKGRNEIGEETKRRQEMAQKLWWKLFVFLFVLAFIELTFANRIYV
ncbi:MAG: BatA and WFA domain-containing protein [Candidatus Firestonebacteria bacterium]